MAASDLGMVSGAPGALAALLMLNPSHSGPFWVTQPQQIPSNLTIPAGMELHFVNGGTLKPLNGVTVRILGRVTGGPYPAFDLSAGGKISFAGNAHQDKFCAEWWIGNDYGSGADCSARLNAMIDAAPDYTAIEFLRSGALTLKSSLFMHGRTGLKLRSPRAIEETPSVILQDGGIAYNADYGGVNVVILDSCGHCELEGFWIRNVTGGGTNCSGIYIGKNGPPRISTNNTVRHCRITNANSSAAWRGVVIAKDGVANNEFMQLLGNYLDGNGMGTGIYVGDNSNNHGHFLFRNTTAGCAIGVDGAWAGFYALHHNANNCGIVFRVQHMSWPVVIDWPDCENCRQILVAGTAGESTITLRNGRFAGCGASGVAWFDFAKYMPEVTIEGCDYQNYALSPNNSILYRLPWQGGSPGGQSLILRGNHYENLEHQGFPAANYLVRTGPSAYGPLIPVNIDSELLTGGMKTTPEVHPDTQSISRGAVQLFGNEILKVNSGPLSTINIYATEARANLATRNRMLTCVIVAIGGAVVVNTGGNIVTGGTIAQDTGQRFMYDQEIGKWRWMH